MTFDSVVTRRSFFKGGLALTAGLFFDFPRLCAANANFPHSPEEAVGETAMRYLFDRTPIEPVKVFDNLYYIGSISVAQFVISTNEGLIMIDSGWDEKDADYAAVSMEKLGLSPADTRYILVTHGHSDHYGGAQFFKDKYAPHAKIGLNVIDSNWDSVIPSEGAEIDRMKLASLVYADKSKLKMLNGLVHPEVKEWIREDIEKHRLDKKCKLYIIEEDMCQK